MQLCNKLVNIRNKLNTLSFNVIKSSKYLCNKHYTIEYNINYLVAMP